MRNYESEFGTKQSCSYEVRHFYKKLFFNPGICFDQNPFPNKNSEFPRKNESNIASSLQKIQVTQAYEPLVSCRIPQEDNSSRNSCCESFGSETSTHEEKEKLPDTGFEQVNKMFV